ncbi:MAG TPA: 50S ribosomal protein L17 [Patescibacteria group bacterium]|nr:50S ribosomal protein L17 [Patescibacteria group bacterium]
MRHRVFGRKLSRDINARKALLSNLATSLIVNGKLTTTVAKAKFAGSYVEKLITSAKGDRLFANRKLASVLSPAAFKKLVGEIAPGFSERHGGYLRIVKQITRRGDNAQMARLELLEWDKTKVKVPKVVKAKPKPKPKKSKVTKKDKSNPRKSVSKSANSNKK